ncbi:putative ribonuclease H-like domain-containing protein [Tanacetum coccineum]|uniref:Ribonuclease H-like domain-containing protein n=1 Tax=Tanacetum coccineum TaxID=301880 RepID=A0ABQ5B4R2_9ASTR
MARSLLLMALPNEHQLTFSQYSDAKTMFAAIETRFGVWMNKADIETMSYDDLYNNFKIVEQDAKKSVGASSVCTVSPNINTACPQVSTANFSDNTVYAFMVENPNGSNLLHQDLEQIHKDDLEAMDLKYDKSKVECFNCHKMRHFSRECRAPRNMMGQFGWSDFEARTDSNKLALMAFTDSEDPESKSYGSEDSEQEGKPQQDDIGFIDSGCSRHMTMNIAYLSDFKEFDGGYVTFGGGAHGGRISGKGTLKPDSLDFEDVYFVNELNLNFFSVSQMRDKKNYVLFIDTECLVLSPNFKFPDESQILLKIPKKDNMYSFDMKNIVPKESLTCLVAKATSDESMLWHRRLGHINFKNINKLVKDNLNKVMDDFCREKGIKREYSVARTPQQNGMAERRNRTLIEAARTIGFKPTLSFMRPFGCHVTILNTLDNLGKFDGKSDEDFFVEYSLSSKAFRVYNTRTRRIEENLHIGFLENKPMIEGNGPKWLFDINSLTQSMNYVLVVAGTISNESAGTQGELNADAAYFDSPSKDVSNGEPKSTADDQKQVEDGPHNESDEKDKSEDDSSPKEVNAAEQHVNTASPEVNTGHFKLNTIDPSVNTAS